jgi:hypothetical protein
MKPDLPMAQFRFACFHCRKMVRKTMLRSFYPGVTQSDPGLLCAECEGPLVFVGRYFEPPRRNDLKAWKQLKLRHNRAAGPQSQQKEMQKLLRSAKAAQRQKQLHKRQERLASRSRPGRSLTSRTLTTDDRWLSLEQRI